MATTLEQPAQTAARPRPRFSRPEPIELRLPAGKRLGAVLGITIAPNGDRFLIHQCNAQGLDPEDEKLDCWMPPLVRFSADGEVLDAWGGPDQLPKVDGVSQWPKGLEGLNCDDEGNLWIFGYGAGDHVVLRFTPSGELLLRLGQREVVGDDHDLAHFHRPTSVHLDVATREAFISDGYGNHRIIAFNVDTGEFTRLWGAYGKDPRETPDDMYQHPVHRVIRGPGGRLYVADRTGCKVQEFAVTPDSVRYTREVFVAPGSNALNTGSCWDVAFTNDEKFMLVGDGVNFRVWSVDLESFEVLGSTTVATEHEQDGNRPLHYTLLHRFAVEPGSGDLLVASVNRGLLRLKYLGVN